VADMGALENPALRICPGCGAEFSPLSPARVRVYCTTACARRSAQYLRRKGVTSRVGAPTDAGRGEGAGCPGQSPGSIGAYCELRVSADLLSRGFDVFRSVSPTSSCDLIAVKEGKCLRVEVRAARGTLESPSFYKDAKDCGRSDHYAAVLRDGIVYLPPLPDTAT
jgi:hypothetical protein